MKIFANDGTEFKTVDEALAYEKAQKQEQDENVQKLKDLAKALNDTIDAMKKDGWRIEGEWKKDGLSLTCFYEKTLQMDCDELPHKLSDYDYFKALIGGIL